MKKRPKKSLHYFATTLRFGIVRKIDENCPAAIADYPTIAEKCRGMKGNCPRKKLTITYMA